MIHQIGLKKQRKVNKECKANQKIRKYMSEKEEIEQSWENQEK